MLKAPAHAFSGAEVFRGLGAPDEKSEALLLVSVQPRPARRTAVVLEGAMVGALSEQLAVGPKPTKSCTPAAKGQPVPVSAVVVFTSATLPAPAAIGIATSGVGRFVVSPA